MLEGPEVVQRCAWHLAAWRDAHPKVRVYFKGSFDKANRSSSKGTRGPGLEVGLALLDSVKREFSLPVCTDVHETMQVAPVAAVCDVLQIPAFLSRQTDLIEAAARTGRIVNIKKGQFMDAAMATNAHAKAQAAGATEIWLTERGTSFGYGDLVVDFRTSALLLRQGLQVMYDATHSVQRPGARGDSSGGDRDLVLPLAAAARAVGVRHLFAEFHPRPSEALSDRETQCDFAMFDELVGSFFART